MGFYLNKFYFTMKLLIIVFVVIINGVVGHDENESILEKVANLVCNGDNGPDSDVTSPSSLKGKKGPKGEKGEPGADCDVTENLDDVTNNVEQLDRENKVLNEKVSALEKIIDG